MEKKGEGKKKAEEKRKYCDEEHIREAVAYCIVCEAYVCETCQVDKHCNHEVTLLEAVCLKKYSECKNAVYEVKMALKQYEKLLESCSVDETLTSITSKVASKYDELIEKLVALKEKKMKEVLEDPEIQANLHERKARLEESLLNLRTIQDNMQKLMAQVEDDFTNKRNIILFEQNLETQISVLRKQLQEWKTSSSSSPLKLQELAADIHIELRAKDHKLNSLVKIWRRSRPMPQMVYDYDNEHNKLLLFNMELKTTQVIEFGLQFHIPFHHSSVLLGSKLYFSGGDDDGYRKDCFAVSIAKGSVKKLSDINVERRNHAMAAFHIVRTLYIAGGYNKTATVLNSVEKYEVSKGTWVQIAPLIEKRQWPTLCQFNCSLLYCFAGSTLDTIERLDISNEEQGWALVPLTKKPDNWVGRSACAAIQCSTSGILVFGGCAKKDVDDVFIFDPQTRALEKLGPMPMPSLYCQDSPVVSGTYIGVIGWRNQHLYIFDMLKGQWTLVKPEAYRPADFEAN
jgi:hypothetical protein